MKYTSGHYANLPRADWGGTLTGASTGAKMGASVGSIFGPIGGLIGTGLGMITGGIFGNSSENKRLREQKRQDVTMAKLKLDVKNKSDLAFKKQTFNNDRNYLNSVDLNNMSSLYMKKGGWIQKATSSIKRRGTEGVCTGSKFGSSSCPAGSKRYNLAKTFRKMAKNRADGGQVAVNGKELGDGDKLLTKNGTTIGSHETGQNIPLRKNGKVVAIAEPGEVLVNDKSMPMTPFVLSKRIGRNGRNGLSFAKEYMALENMKNKYNSRIIEKRQAGLIRMNDSVAPSNKFAGDGISISNLKANSLFSKFPGLQKTNNSFISKSNNGFLKSLGEKAKGLDTNTLFGAAGTIGNLIMSNQTLKRQKNLINNSLTEALAYEPKLHKNYLLNEEVNVADQVSGVNQGFSSAISGLSGVDSATASALKNSANLTRNNALNSIYGNRDRTRIGLRNQNVMGIMQNNANNTSLTNESNLMKLNAKIAANEQLGDAEAARLGNVQGAISEFNTILRDKESMNSLKARWKDTIGNDAFGTNYKCGGRIGRKRRRAA